MKANKHLLLWSSVAIILMVGWAAYKEHYQQEWRKLQREYHAELAKLGKQGSGERLRQVVVPALGAFDRCVSCHIGMLPGEPSIPGHRVFGPHPKVVHSPVKFGCVACHGGQGRATVKADAHGNVPHWPEPMIPRRYMWAGCGGCHTHLSVPKVDEMRRGRKLVESKGCLTCHQIDGKGGTVKGTPASGAVSGPDLSHVGVAGFEREWHETHLDQTRHPDDAAQGPMWRASFKALTAIERRTIGVYLRSRVGAPELVDAKALVYSMGCLGCHKVHGVGGDDGPELSNFGNREPAHVNYSKVTGKHSFVNWIKQHFIDPAKVVPGSTMPKFKLTSKQLDLLTLYMLSLRLSPSPEAFWPADRAKAIRGREREFATTGESLYGTFCAACHGADAMGREIKGVGNVPAIGNPEFLAVADDRFLKTSIRRGRPSRRMPGWAGKAGGLRNSEILAIVRYLRRLGGGKRPKPDTRPARWVKADAKVGAALYAEHCEDCHGTKGQGDTGLALNNQLFLRAATDTFLVDTITRGRDPTDMPGFTDDLKPEQILAVVAFIRKWDKNPKRAADYIPPLPPPARPAMSPAPKPVVPSPAGEPAARPVAPAPTDPAAARPAAMRPAAAPARPGPVRPTAPSMAAKPRPARARAAAPMAKIRPVPRPARPARPAR